MPLTFIDIERQKSLRIWLFFLVLMLLYFCITVLFAALFLPLPLSAAPRFWVFSGVMAVFTAAIHFWFSAYDSVSVVTRTLGGAAPDGQDDVHRVLLNIMDEIHVVTGRRRKISCFVVPSLSLNALAVADLKGASAIGITEGLLSRLTRPQLEAVIAHEAHHIFSGDCLETTVAASLFGTYASVIEKLRVFSRGRTFASPAFVLAWVLLQFSYLLNLFISRQREYRADAAAVRMTRNPISLAEALHLLSRSWRGAGFIGSGFEMLCIVNPQATAVDETEGFWPDLISTHPPIAKRIEVLLSMARVSIADLDAKAAAREGRKAEPGTGPRYYALNPQQQWQGPFGIDELGILPWLSPLTWVTTGAQQPVERAWKQSLLAPLFVMRLSGKQREVSENACPACRQPLMKSSYEGTKVLQCGFCAGSLVENGKIARIIARTGRERPCSERITALARAVINQNQFRRTSRKTVQNTGPVPHIACPRCAHDMHRTFYSSAYLIEVDRCESCGLTWFDQDELAMLQCLIENRITPSVLEGAFPFAASGSAS